MIDQPKVAINFTFKEGETGERVATVFIDNMFNMMKLHWNDAAMLEEIRKAFLYGSEIAYDRIGEIKYPSPTLKDNSPTFNELKPIDSGDAELVCKNDGLAATFKTKLGEYLCMECKKKEIAS